MRTASWTRAGHNGGSTSTTQTHNGVRGSLSDEYLPYIFGHSLLNNQQDSHVYCILLIILYLFKYLELWAFYK